MKAMALRRAALVSLLALLGGCGAAMVPLAGGRAGFDMAAKTVDPPQWTKDAVFYQIFPERFANGNKANDPKGTEPWGGKPTFDNYFGGDLKGIRQHLDHLQDLGVTALYLNPIFTADSNHKYNATDYMQIDPAFGTIEDFRALVADLKKRKMRIILDGVFNHTGDKFWAFQDAMAKGKESPTWSWYNIFGFPVVQNPKPNYDAWWGFASLPKLNFNNPKVPEYLLHKVVDFWTREGIDGWRLDVPNEVTLPGFWEKFRQKVRSINPEAYIVGEIWDDPTSWLQGDKFDATMNYPLREELLHWLVHRDRNVDTFDAAVATQRRGEGQATNGMFNIMGSHDVERLLHLSGGDKSKVRLMALMTFAYPGAPVIYYGDEIGMTGAKDPDDRRCFDWNKTTWDTDTFRYFKKLIAIRRDHPGLRDGWFQTLMRHNDKNQYAFYRDFMGKDRLLVGINNGMTDQDLVIPTKDTAIKDGTVLTDLLTGTKVTVTGGQVVMAKMPRGGVILAADPGQPRDGRR